MTETTETTLNRRKNKGTPTSPKTKTKVYSVPTNNKPTKCDTPGDRQDHRGGRGDQGGRGGWGDLRCITITRTRDEGGGGFPEGEEGSKTRDLTCPGDEGMLEGWWGGGMLIRGDGRGGRDERENKRR
jgi:hypothetical protein